VATQFVLRLARQERPSSTRSFQKRWARCWLNRHYRLTILRFASKTPRTSNRFAYGDLAYLPKRNTRLAWHCNPCNVDDDSPQDRSTATCLEPLQSWPRRREEPFQSKAPVQLVNPLSKSYPISRVVNLMTTSSRHELGAYELVPRTRLFRCKSASNKASSNLNGNPLLYGVVTRSRSAPIVTQSSNYFLI
jgi:hypothetical protein